MEVSARELPCPALTYQRELVPREGTWDMRGVKFNQAKPIERWLVLVFDSDRYFRLQEAQTAISGLVSACQAAGQYLLTVIRVFIVLIHFCITGMAIKKPQPDIHYVPPNARSDIPKFIQQKGSELVKREGGPPQMSVRARRWW